MHSQKTEYKLTHTYTQLVQLTQCNFNVLNKPCPGCAAAHTGIVNFIELIHILGNCNDNTHSKLSQQFLIYYSQTTYYHSRTLFPFFRSISHDDSAYVRIYYIPFTRTHRDWDWDTQTRTRARKYDSLLIICHGLQWYDLCVHLESSLCFALPFSISLAFH